MLHSYDSEVFRKYYSLEAERGQFERWLNKPRDFDDEGYEEWYYEQEVRRYLDRVRKILESD